MNKNANEYSFIFLSLFMAMFVLIIGTKIPDWERAHKDLDRRLHKVEKPETDVVKRVLHKITFECDEYEGKK